MNTLNIHRVVEVTLVTRNHGNFNVHNLITKDQDGVKTEVSIYTNEGKELIRSLNGKKGERINLVS